MLPPVEASVLQNNPEFAALHHTLTTAILNPDGSTRKPATKEHDAIQNELADHRFTAAKEHLLISAISNTAPPEPKSAPPRTISRTNSSSQPQPSSSGNSTTQQQPLPEPLLDLLLLLPPLLTSPSPLSLDSATILLSNPPFTDFQSLLPPLGDLLSSTLHTSAVSLARIANPTTNPSFLHRAVPGLQTTYHKLASDVSQSKLALARERLRAADTLTQCLDEHAAALTLLVRSLEAKHGVVARSLEFRAAETGLEAQRAEADAVAAREGVRREVYSPEMVAALTNYSAHLRDARMRLEGTLMTLRAELEGYGVGVEGEEGKARTMREMARKKRQMERELEDASRDLARLDRA
ncbi:hypothetical protein HER10_EVM0005197 [Colletotrichum scovillei]|uniref:Uncharacterized protein n=1 Tax=Colletotrichum scovillei TaxID=1209932 RepID=A0A9P7U9S5_9PEZI|nr:uncharacterized protein HER10_EVM0005197 [Colletotrichum scovillei]KAF4776308.1 hypothetical protein HER10_EVM0005197 [Colletotrichum scovillei]KAG7047769.1 hypothetical protein JMJ77_0011111 [Colletotrichum scovillei]KAG7060083.1 hypothetical protein JMJ78_0015362 [Colletotrichum scovillei]KAG7067535.1 hypothetical protein JMJ76_0008967 [Colletotrichum scovillei]